MAAGEMPKWTARDESVKAVSVSDTSALGDSKPIQAFQLRRKLTSSDTGATHSIGLPIHVYPLYENGFRAHRGQTIAENNDESASLYADFAKVAERNVYSWNFAKPAKTKEEIATVSKKNRMICFPYPLLMFVWTGQMVAYAQLRLVCAAAGLQSE
jgi:hypothetical protein